MSDLSVIKAGYAGDLIEVMALVSKGADINGGSMGASTRQDEIREAHGESKYTLLNPTNTSVVRKLVGQSIKKSEDFELYMNLEKVVNWCLSKGACLIFTFVQTHSSSMPDISNHFFSRVSMLKGPGEVVKGSFAGVVA